MGVDVVSYARGLRQTFATMTLEQLGLVGLAIGVALTIAAPFFMDLGYDANAFVATGHGWARTGELVLAWGEVLTFHPTPPMHSHHFPPLYPLYLGVFFKLFGYGLLQAKLAALLMGLASIAVVYACTRDLYGRTAAALVGALVALHPAVLTGIGMGYSESLSLLLFTLTVWAIVKSLTNERSVLLAGLFAGLAYLARSSMGAFFLLAGGAGFAWRLKHRGLRGVFGTPWYPIAIALFGAIVGTWAWRNIALFGWPNWETSPGVRGVPRWIWEHPTEFGLGILVRTPLMLAVFAPLALASAERRRALARWREEHASALWLAVGLTLALGLLFSAAYFSMGPSRYEAGRLDTARYVLVGIVPLAWLFAREADDINVAQRRRWLAIGLALLVLCGAVFAFPGRWLPAEGARALDPWLEPGDVIAVGGAGKYPFYAYVSEPQTLTVYTDGNGPNDPTFIVATYAIRREGYVVLAEETIEHKIWPASPDDHVTVLGRADIVAQRAIVFGELRAGW